MNKFIYKSGLFILPIVIIIFVVEYNLKNVINLYNGKKIYLEQKLDSIHTLVLGSSQAAYGINPDYFDKQAFNLSSPSQSLYYDNRLTMQYVDKLQSLQHVIITVSYFSFGYQIIDGKENWRDFYYSQFWKERFPEVNQFDLRNFSKIILYQPDSSFKYLINGFEVNTESRMTSSGFFKMDSAGYNNRIDDLQGKTRVDFHDNYYSESRISENVSDLRNLINELKRRDVKPILVTCPVFGTYSKFQDSDKLISNKNIIEQICKEYQCRYFDYSNDVRFLKADFYDNDHLNFVGAEKFSEILNDEVL